MLFWSLRGHYDEVTGLVVLRDGEGRGRRLSSVSLDGTVRTWPLDKEGLDAAVKEQEEASKGKEDEEAKGDAGNGMTAEEEAELAALMDDDD
jgi:WD40 repeat protein